MQNRVESVNYHTQPTFQIIFSLHAQHILHHYSLRYSLTERTSYIIFTIRLSSVLHDNPNSYSIGKPLKENVIALLVNSSRSEFNSRYAISIFHLYKILLITVWTLGSVRNKYQKYFVGGKGDLCEGLTTLPSSCATVLKFKSPGI